MTLIYDEGTHAPEKKCNACGGELKPIKEFVNFYYNDFVKMLGREPKESTKFNCIICGLIYDEEFFNTGNRIDWWEALKKHYENEKTNGSK